MPHRGEISTSTIASCHDQPSGRRLSCALPQWMRLLLLAITVLGASGFTASSANAQCGHYVIIMNPSDAAKANAHSPTGDHAAMSQVTAKTSPAIPHKPCNGPMCRGQQPRSVPPAMPVPPSPTTDHQAMASADITLIPASSSLIAPCEFHLPGITHLSVDAPPPRF